jgi:succinylglutamate desuccinylase
METSQQHSTEQTITTERIVGKRESDIQGNLLLVTAGIHGNEASGIKALRRVLKALDEREVKLKGTLLGVAGNIGALGENKRFIDEDLNRTWPTQHLKEIEQPNHEQREMQDIVRVIEAHPASEYGIRYFIDCHSTSSESLPYISVQDKGDNDAWAHTFPLYIVRGFSDLVSGSIDRYLSHNHFTGFAFEAGQHTHADTIDHHEAIIWLGMEKAGLLNLQDLENPPRVIAKMMAKEDPKTFQIVYRHNLEKGDEFSMKPGFKNFQAIQKGEELAEHNGNTITSQWEAYIFMPLYQSQGNDGFFVVEEV